MAQRLLKLDYVGICFSICVTDITSTYLGLYDKSWWRTFYNTFCILCGIALLFLVMGLDIDGPGAASFRYALILSPYLTRPFEPPPLPQHCTAVAVMVDILPTNVDWQFDSVFIFLALMLGGFAPIIHMYLLEGFEGIRHFPLLHIAYMELCYFIGTAFYLSHWPERYWPETFDIWVSVFPFLSSALTGWLQPQMS